MNMEKQKYVIIIADENSDEMVKFSNPISAWAYMIAREEYKKPKKDAFKIVDLVFDRWQEAFKNVGLEPESYANRKVSLEANLPWDHINTGVSKKFLTKQYKLSLEGKTTSDCRDQCCLGCGVCEHPEINEVKGEISTDEIKA